MVNKKDKEKEREEKEYNEREKDAYLALFMTVLGALLVIMISGVTGFSLDICSLPWQLMIFAIPLIIGVSLIIFFEFTKWLFLTETKWLFFAKTGRFFLTETIGGRIFMFTSFIFFPIMVFRWISHVSSCGMGLAGMLKWVYILYFIAFLILMSIAFITGDRNNRCIVATIFAFIICITIVIFSFISAFEPNPNDALIEKMNCSFAKELGKEVMIEKYGLDKEEVDELGGLHFFELPFDNCKEALAYRQLLVYQEDSKYLFNCDINLTGFE